MKRSRRDLLLALGGVVSYARFGGVRAQTDFASYSDADREAFLRGGAVLGGADGGKAVRVGVDDHVVLARPGLGARRSSSTSRRGSGY